jgi:hypothetical protein
LQTGQPERRKHRRFVMELDLLIVVAHGQLVVGQLRNMSSGGILFRCGVILPVGQLVEAELTWPLLMENGAALLLRVHGLIVRSDSEGTAISISKYHFHPSPSV